MVEATEPCPQCGTPQPAAARFCGQCGFDRSAAKAPAQAASAAPDPRKQTMLGVMPVAPVAAAPASPATPPAAAAFAPVALTPAVAQAQAAPAAPAGKPKMMTMLGMPATTAGLAPPAGAPAASPPAASPTPGFVATAPSAAAPSAPEPKPNRTMLGLPAAAMMSGVPGGPPPAQPAPAPASAQQASAQQAGMFAPTMPMPMVQAPAQPAPAHPMPAQHAPVQLAPAQLAPAQPAPAQPTPQAPLPAATNRTMLGVSMPQAAQTPAQPSHQAPGPTTNRTMLGVAMQAPAGVEAPPSSTPAFVQSEETPFPPPTRRSPVPLIVLGVLAVVLIGGGVAAFFMMQGGPDVRATIVQAESGEALQVDVPGAEAGAKARFNGAELPLEAGRALFPLTANQLQLGDNAFVVDVVGAGGDVEQAQIIVSVPFRVRADLSALEADDPKLRIVVDAVPGSTVALDEQPVVLDGSGHGLREYPLDSGEDAPFLERVVRYRVTSPGVLPSDGQVTTRIPFATLQLERPGASTVTDAERIEVLGAAHPEARVTLDGNPVELNGEGRFRTFLALSQLGAFEHVVVAHQAGRAPRRRALRIQRVADLRAEAASYPVETDMTYARLVENPDAYRGHKASFVGRVYNVDVADGHSVLQMIVRDCPTGQRCPMWVSYEGAPEQSLQNTWIQAIGELAGEQQFRSPSGQVNTVPRIDAVFVLAAQDPAAPAPRRRRR